MAEWLTYERYGKQSFTRTADEPPMRNGWVPRPATEIEIADEVARRIERDTERCRRGHWRGTVASMNI